MRVLLTGGAGYIGSHVAVVLADAGHGVAIVDDLSGVSAVALDRIREVARQDIPFLQADIRDEDTLLRFVEGTGPFDAIVHLAGAKSVAESVADPLRYYDVNVGGAVSLIRVARQAGIAQIVFSSSATVYSDGAPMPVSEDAATGLDQASPYGTSKRIVEKLLADVARADTALRTVSLRYFNPVGAHPSGRIGEDPLGEAQNLMPVVARAATRGGAVSVYGVDYPTPDGTAQRDYVHVMDLAHAHLAAIEHAPQGSTTYNIGTGTPVSVLELVDAFERASGRSIPRTDAPRRPGDLPVSFADPSKARRELGWVATRTIDEACIDYWRWQQANPAGYRS